MSEQTVTIQTDTEVGDEVRRRKVSITIHFDQYRPRMDEHPRHMVSFIEDALNPHIGEEIERAYREGVQEGVKKSKKKLQYQVLAALAEGAGFDASVAHGLRAAAEGQTTIGVKVEE